MASMREFPHISCDGRKEAQTAGRSGEVKIAHRKSSVK